MRTYTPYQHFESDPVIELYPRLPLQLAIDTSQIGRTFQDRTHIFQIHPRPSRARDNDQIYNLGVRGRRGNAQQTYPAMEYDFSPTSMTLTSNDLVHIQWEGSNTQPKNAAGEGHPRTDRHNMVSMDAPNWNIPQGQISGAEFNISQTIFIQYFRFTIVW